MFKITNKNRYKINTLFFNTYKRKLKILNFLHITPVIKPETIAYFIENINQDKVIQFIKFILDDCPTSINFNAGDVEKILLESQYNPITNNFVFFYLDKSMVINFKVYSRSQVEELMLKYKTDRPIGSIIRDLKGGYSTLNGITFILNDLETFKHHLNIIKYGGSSFVSSLSV